MSDGEVSDGAGLVGIEGKRAEILRGLLGPPFEA